ncbi:MAG: DUF1211 domain-containing protein [Candidatus Omnitrophica bacterium]|nr:DUF1211 domain-containing protein [Candidatus Omnitrophota bacterium]
MPKTRLEAFSDGVIAIIITIMVLEIKIPHGADLVDLKPLIPVFLSYLLSFIYVGIYWINHHHLLHTAKLVNAKIMWSNLMLLFWLSLIPFSTNWLGENHGGTWPTAVYGMVLLLAGFSYLILQSYILKTQGQDDTLAKAIGKDWKGKASMAGYALAIVLAFVNQWFSDILYISIALMWIIPDQRFEKATHN